MVCLLKFLVEEHLNTWLKDQLSLVYDHIYVEDTLISDIKKHQQKVFYFIIFANVFTNNINETCFQKKKLKK